MDKGKPVRLKVNPKIVPGEGVQSEGRSEKVRRGKKSITDYFEDRKRAQKDRAMTMEKKWELI